VPSALSALAALQQLDLSCNAFSGRLPALPWQRYSAGCFVGGPRLASCPPTWNASRNDFACPLPTGVPAGCQASCKSDDLRGRGPLEALAPTGGSAAHAASFPWLADARPDGPCPIHYPQGCPPGITFCQSPGKQRALVHAAGAGRACAAIPWRRFDDPATKAVVVTTAAGALVPAANLTNSSRAEGTVCFEAAAAGLHAVYFLPFKWAMDGGSGSYCAIFLNRSETFRARSADDDRWATLATWVAAKLPAPAAPATDVPLQNFSLPAPATGTSFRYRCAAGYSQYQSLVAELRVKTRERGWLPNTATAADPWPVKKASSLQPESKKAGGAAWAAMDGDVRTVWDPVSNPSWLELDLGPAAVTVEAISVVVVADGTHEPRTIEFQARGGGRTPRTQHIPR
jgi:hypothetical protein